MKKSREIRQLEEDYWQLKQDQKESFFQKLIINNGYDSKRLRQEYMTKFSEGSANDLTKAIIALFYVCGGSAWRINTMGVYDKKTGKYRNSGASLGVSDVIGCLNGAMYAVEVKYGKDRLSDNQKKFQAQVERSGGMFIVARTLKDVDEKIRPLAALTRVFDLTPATEREKKKQYYKK